MFSFICKCSTILRTEISDGGSAVHAVQSPAMQTHRGNPGTIIFALNFKIDVCFIVLGEVTQRSWLPSDPRSGLGQLEAFLPHFAPGMHILSTIVRPELLRGWSLERVKRCWDHLNWTHEGTSIWTLKILMDRCGVLLILPWPWTSLVSSLAY